MQNSLASRAYGIDERFARDIRSNRRQSPVMVQTYEGLKMRELNQEEVNAVAGAGWLADLVDDIQYAIEQAPSIYESAIDSTADMMCTATGDC